MDDVKFLHAISNRNYAEKLVKENKTNELSGDNSEISNSQKEELQQKYGADVNKWEKDAATEYEIDGELDANSLDKTNGEKTSKADLEKIKNNDKTKNGVNLAMSSLSTGSAVVGSVGLAVSASQLAATGVVNAASAATAGIGWMIACPTSLAVGVLYEATRPNVDARDALMQYKDLMLQYQSALEQGAVELDTAQEAVQEKTDEAVNKQEQAQEDVETYKEEQLNEIEAKQQVVEYNKAMAKEIAGRKDLSPADRAKYADAVANMKEAGEDIQSLNLDMASNIETMQSEAASEVNAMQSDIKNSESEVANKAVTISEVQETVDLVASLDEATRNNAIAEATMQSLNAATGFTGGALATATAVTNWWNPIGWVATAFAAMGFTGGALSTHGAVEQSKVAIDVKGVIDTRTDTQAKIDAALGQYESVSAVVDDASVDVNNIGQELEEFDLGELELDDPAETVAETEMLATTGVVDTEQSEEPEPVASNEDTASEELDKKHEEEV